jgi:hypothetical protein
VVPRDLFDDRKDDLDPRLLEELSDCSPTRSVAPFDVGDCDKRTSLPVEMVLAFGGDTLRLEDDAPENLLRADGGPGAGQLAACGLSTLASGVPAGGAVILIANRTGRKLRF